MIERFNKGSSKVESQIIGMSTRYFNLKKVGTLIEDNYADITIFYFETNWSISFNGIRRISSVKSRTY